MQKRTTLMMAAILAISACVKAEQAGPTPDHLWNAARPALESITASDLLQHIKVLSSDEFEGRAPGSRGEELSVKYITERLQAIGLKPGNPDGTYVQNVPLVGFTGQPTATLTAGGKSMSLRFPDEYVAVSRHFKTQIDVDNSDIVFVGYGVVAPEYGWDDYKGVDVRGKTILMLINDPAVPDPGNPSKLDPNMFKGNAMTYYGRWTYKYEIASEKGAAAAIIIHETGPAGYPYEVVSGSWGRENFDIKNASGNAERARVESWIRNDKARELLAAAGQDLDALKRAAVRKDFRPVALNAQASIHIKNTLREVQSKNVVGRLEGEKKDEYVVYSAHWDHLGKDASAPGDGIYNGAIDNASGVATVLELAQAFTKLGHKPERSLLFLFVTAEEKGLLGAKWYGNNPLYPMNKTVANINIDGVNQWGRTKDLVLVGYGNSTLDDLTIEAARHQGRTIVPDPEPQKGFFYRSDHFEFAKQGVPALDPDAGVDYIGKPAGYGERKREEYTNNDYHKPADEVKPDWDLSGAIEDAQLFFMVGYMVTQGERWPEWKSGTEFKAKREASLK
ncbi:MAG TPA: M28 family metallopeptidase [Longimicrobiales bacterium]|nr:M28 family metallopeptidase [Longimicrobiales bacterium]